MDIKPDELPEPGKWPPEVRRSLVKFAQDEYKTGLTKIGAHLTSRRGKYVSLDNLRQMMKRENTWSPEAKWFDEWLREFPLAGRDPRESLDYPRDSSPFLVRGDPEQYNLGAGALLRILRQAHQSPAPEKEAEAHALIDKIEAAKAELRELSRALQDLERTLGLISDPSELDA